MRSNTPQPCLSQPCLSQPCLSQPCLSQPCLSQPCLSQPCLSQDGLQQHARPHPISSQAGIALISVLWVVTLLSLLATALVASQRTETETTRLILQQAQARQSAEAAVHLTLMQLLERSLQPDSDTAGELATVQFAGYAVQIELLSEAGKADLNQLNEAVLKTLISGLVSDTEASQAVADAILDWRDGDDLVRLQGAEARDYQRADLPFSPANRPFQNLEELQRVMGMTAQLYLQLEPLLTLHSRQSHVDLSAASPAMLTALGQQAGNVQRQFLSARSSRLLSINTRASLTGRPLAQLLTTVALKPSTLREPFTFLDWKFVSPGESAQALTPSLETPPRHAPPQAPAPHKKARQFKPQEASYVALQN